MNKHKIKIIMTVLLSVALVFVFTGCGETQQPAGSAADAAPAAQETKETALTKAQLQQLADAKIIAGIQDYRILQGTEVDLQRLRGNKINILEKRKCT